MSRVIIIPEPHISCTNIDGRRDYVAEIKSYMNEIMSHIKSEDSITDVAFVGDIFNRGFKDVDEYFYWIDWFTNLDDLLDSRGGKIYSAIGNHEVSFSKSNPFWRLTSERDGGFNTVMSYNSASIKPKGLRSIVHVTDVLSNDKVSIFFCHYKGIDLCNELVTADIDEYGDTKTRICISHNSIISNEIASVLRNNYGRDPLTHYIQHEQIASLGLFHKFDYVFNGHMHKAYSQFKIEDESTGHFTRLGYLGSIGRTNSEEVNDNDLDRILPVVDFNNGTVQVFPIRLISREGCLADGYTVAKENRKFTEEEYKDVCSKLEDIGDPIEQIMEVIDDRDMLVALDCAISMKKPQTLEDILTRSERI